MITTLLLVLVLASLGCAVAVGVLVVPFVLAVDMGERRGCSTTRVGAACLVLELAGLGLGYSAVSGGHWWVLPLAVGLAWSGPAVLSRLDTSRTRLGGVIGAHQR